jgi:hypothetical protein
MGGLESLQTALWTKDGGNPNSPSRDYAWYCVWSNWIYDEKNGKIVNDRQIGVLGIAVIDCERVCWMTEVEVEDGR